MIKSESQKKGSSQSQSSLDVIHDNNPRILEIITSRHKSSSYQLLNLTKDFFGLLESKSKEESKMMVLETYKLIFRFSIGKLIEYLKDESFVMILLQYIRDTKMQRVHKREVLFKNYGAYYKAMENMLNLSDKAYIILSVLRSRIHKFEGCKIELQSINMSQLKQINESKGIQIT